jgi:hypothetical protein
VAAGSEGKTGPLIQRRNAYATRLSFRLLASESTAECGDLTAVQGEVALEQDRIGKAGLVEGAGNLRGDDNLAIATGLGR